MPLFKEIRTLGATALIIQWEEKLSESILADILGMQKAIHDHSAFGYAHIVPSLNSIGIVFDDQVEDIQSWKNLIQQLEYSPVDLTTTNTWEIPVCYGDEHGIDLAELSAKLNLTEEEVIRLHTAPKYRVYGIGFLPGFPYLGGLDPKLHCPRKPTPRRSVPKGSVGIGGEQTGIYPQVSPGGWNIIGQTPLLLFDAQIDPPCVIQPGDELIFNPIDPLRFKEIEKEVKRGKYQWQKA